MVNMKANELAKTVADDKNVFYLDIGPKFLAADGTLSKEIMPDFLHLSAKGYEIWAKSIEPAVCGVAGRQAARQEVIVQLRRIHPQISQVDAGFKQCTWRLIRFIQLRNLCNLWTYSGACQSPNSEGRSQSSSKTFLHSELEDHAHCGPGFVQLIFECPFTRSTKVIGVSPMRQPGVSVATRTPRETNSPLR